MSGEDVITLSSDSECEIVETKPKAEVDKKRNVISGLKAQLSQIRGLFPQKKPGTDKTDNPTPQASSESTSGSKPTNGNKFATFGTVSSAPQEVLLDDDDFEIEYGDPEEESNHAKKSGSGDEDSSDLQILDSGSSSPKDGSHLSAGKANGVDKREKKVSSPVEEIELEEEDDDFVARSENLVTAFGLEFAQCRQPGVKLVQIEKAKAKLWETYQRLSSYPMPIHVRLQEEILSGIQSLKASPKKYWSVLKNLLDKMVPAEITKLAEVPVSVRKQAQEAEKQALLLEAEKKLKKLHKHIKKLEEAEVDFDDEENDHNSPYMMVEKAKKKLVEAYYRICDISKCSRLTGRPTQKSIKLAKHGASSRYEDVDVEVEKFVNKGGFLFIPDYIDILTIVNSVTQSKKLALSPDAALVLAQTTFENVVRIIKKRRQKDLTLSMICHLPALRNKKPAPAEKDEDDEEHEIEDPAEIDPELQAKLAENEPLKKSENEVIEHFVQLAQRPRNQANGDPEEANANGSPPPSDSENEADEDEDEANSEDDAEGGAHNISLAAHEEDELTEDEDEEPETVSIDVLQQERLELEVDDDETSNEGRTTAAESECDSLVDSILNKTSDKNTELDKKRKSSESEDGKQSKEVPETSEPPPSKKIRSDENSNESLDGDSTLKEMSNIDT